MINKKQNNKYPILTDKQELGRRILMENRKWTEILFDGGARAGKTYLILFVIILFCMYYSGVRVLIARMKFAHANASLWIQTLMPLIRTLQLPCRIDKTLHIVRIGKSEIWLGGLDNKEKTEKVLGQEYGIIFLNESVEIPESIRDVLKTRLAQKVDGFKNFMIYDCNPRQPTHYLYKEFYGINREENRIALKFLPQDNKDNLPEGYIENILAKLPEDKRVRFLDGKWSYSPGAVYQNVHESNIIECDKNLYSGFYDDFVIGVDWGLHMCAVLWGIKQNSAKIKAYCIHEIIILGGVTSDMINELDKIFGIKQKNIILYCDHEPDRILELQGAGYSAKKAYKDIGPGDSSVNDYELYFDKNCKYTYQSMVNLVNQQNPNGDGFLYGKHVKENDHECLVGDTLILTDRGQVKIKDIKIGDYVLTRKGYKKIYAKKITGMRDVYEYNFYGNKIICTDNHKFYAGNKYKKVKNLTSNDKVYIINARNNIITIKNVQQNINGTYIGNQLVYSISVKDCPEYFANNILVRNSDGSRYALHGWKIDNNIKGRGHYILEKSVI